MHNLWKKVVWFNPEEETEALDDLIAGVGGIIPPPQITQMLDANGSRHRGYHFAEAVGSPVARSPMGLKEVVQQVGERCRVRFSHILPFHDDSLI